jgi:zinc protease
VHSAEIALAASGSYWEYNDAGAFVALASVRPGKSIAEVERRFLAEVERLRREPVRAAELEKAKRQLEVAYVNGLATSHALAERIGQDISTFGRIRPIDERLGRIRAVTAADVLRVAQTYLVDDHRNVVLIVPPSADGAPAKTRGGA